MRKRFAEYITERGYADATTRLEDTASQAQDFREVIGALAMRFELMSLDQVGEVLAQLQPGQKFGDIAVAQGFLSQEDVDKLLDIQTLLETVDVGLHLVLKGRMTCSQLVDELYQFSQKMDRPSHARPPEQDHAA